MKFLYYFLFLLPFVGLSQDCSICPSGSTVTLTSTYNPTATHQWSCTNGFTSSLVSPTFTPSADVTCSLLVTDSNGCSATSQTIVDVCNCDCNDPCVSMSYNATTDCVTFTQTGTNCSPVATDIIQWKNQNTSFATIANNGTICNCNIKEYVNTSSTVFINGSNFEIGVTGLQNRCSPCSGGSNPRIDYQFPISGSTTAYPTCSAPSYTLTISPTAFANNGYVCDAYMRYTTPFGVVVNHYRFAYNGGGLNVANITVTEVAKNTIYKDITAKRTVTYSDGCPAETCELVLDIPQQPNDPCNSFIAYVSNSNLGSPCNAPGYFANTINGVAPLTYQWYYNGTIMSGQTNDNLCLTGQPDGTYCVQITDAIGCVQNVCRVKQASCSLTVSITASGTTLNSTVTGCVGTRTNTWARWNGTSWVTVGTGNSYNTSGVAGDYRLTVSCSGPPVCTAIGLYTYAPPCTSDVTLTTGSTTLTANVTGCGGGNITYLWDRWNGTSWVTVQTITTTSTSNVYTPTLSGLYRVTITCGSCSDQAQTSWTAPNPCTGFSTNITGTFTNMCLGTSRTFGRTITGGTGPFTQQWRLNGTNVSTATTYTFTGATLGTFTISVTITDALGCIFTDTENITVVTCCGMNAILTPTTTSVCTNQSATFTASQTGGTPPMFYSWTSQLLPAGPIGQGTGTTKTLTFGTAGTYNIVLTATDATGCTSNANATMTVTTCTSCVCEPYLTLTGCVLNGGFTGAGCGNFEYQLQYSATGTGWSAVQSGFATSGGTITYTPTANGFYRLVIVGESGSGCQLEETPLVSVTCYSPTCTNPPTLALNGTSGVTCGTSAFTVTGNTFGGSATNVTISDNGVGSVSPSSASSSPFNFTYNPSSGDYGNTVTITVTTNNPLGSPCVPQTRSFNIQVLPVCSPVTLTQSNCILTTTNCTTTGYSWTWQQSDDGVTGWGTVQSSGTSYAGIHTKYYRVVYTKTNCPNITTSVVQSLCPCTANPIIFTGSANIFLCQDRTITFTGGTGPFLYSWTKTGTLTLQQLTPSSNNIILASSEPTGVSGTYIVTVTDANGCTFTRTYTYTSCNLVRSSIAIATVSGGCYGGLSPQTEHYPNFVFNINRNCSYGYTIYREVRLTNSLVSNHLVASQTNNVTVSSPSSCTAAYATWSFGLSPTSYGFLTATNTFTFRSYEGGIGGTLIDTEVVTFSAPPCCISCIPTINTSSCGNNPYCYPGEIVGLVGASCRTNYVWERQMNYVGAWTTVQTGGSTYTIPSSPSGCSNEYALRVRSTDSNCSVLTSDIVAINVCY
jgi:hypothetical protein